MAATTYADLVVVALEHAPSKRVHLSDSVFHTDERGEYGARELRRLLWHCGIEQSIRLKGGCWADSPREHLLMRFVSERIPSLGCQRKKASQ